MNIYFWFLLSFCPCDKYSHHFFFLVKGIIIKGTLCLRNVLYKAHSSPKKNPFMWYAICAIPLYLKSRQLIVNTTGKRKVSFHTFSPGSIDKWLWKRNRADEEIPCVLFPSLSGIKTWSMQTVKCHVTESTFRFLCRRCEWLIEHRRNAQMHTAKYHESQC